MPNSLAPNRQFASYNALGSGLAQGASDTNKLRKLWMQAYSNGETTLQFDEWLKASGIERPSNMPR